MLKISTKFGIAPQSFCENLNSVQNQDQDQDQDQDHDITLDFNTTPTFHTWKILRQLVYRVKRKGRAYSAAPPSGPSRTKQARAARERSGIAEHARVFL